MLPHLERWARTLESSHPEIVGVALLGSYARGDWSVGSDVDLLIEVRTTDAPPLRRPLDYPTPPGPLPADIHVLTSDELNRMRRDGRRFAQTVDREAIWLCRVQREAGTEPDKP